MTTLNSLHEGFDAVADANTRVLVLGSLPGQKSLTQRRYYAHPSNHLWRLLGPVIGTDLVALDYDSRLAALLRARVGLWDVLGSAERLGSLDMAIRNPNVRDLGAMIATLPNLRAVAFNGGTALRHGRRQFGAANGIPVIALPSSSAAHTVGLAAKQVAWDQIRTYLE